MKLRMMSVVSIVIVLLIKSMGISAQDYNNLRILANAIPDPALMTYPLETELDSVVYQLAQANGVMERYVGGSTETVADTYASYQRLKMLASEAELNELLQHNSPIVKVYAYRALVTNDMALNTEYAEELQNDSTCIDWLNGDEVTSTTVAEMILQPYFD